MRGTAAALLVFALAACTGPVLSVSPGPPSPTAVALSSATAESSRPPASQGLEAPDSLQPAAGVCPDLWPGSLATFQLNLDTPNPRCGQVRASQQLRVVNATSTTVTMTLHGVVYLLKPGAEWTFAPTFGAIWQPGVHVLPTSAYGGGGGPEIWLVAE